MTHDQFIRRKQLLALAKRWRIKRPGVTDSEAIHKVCTKLIGEAFKEMKK